MTAMTCRVCPMPWT